MLIFPTKESSDIWERYFTSRWYPYFWIALLGVLVYARTLGFGYVFFDDDHLILKNFDHIGSLKNIFLAFRTDMNWQSPGVYYRPLVTLTFIFDAVWSGKNPWGYHLTNILLHVAANVLLYRFIILLKHDKRIALSVSLIFAAHPLLNHTVAFIPGRYDSLLAVMILSAMISLIAYLEKSSLPMAALHFIAFLAALFTKETAIVFPVICCIFFILFRQPGKEYRKIIIPGTTWLLAAAIFFFFRGPVAGNISIKYNTFGENLAGLLSYLGKVLLPYNLSVMPIPQNTPLWPGMITLVLLLILFALGRICRQRYFLFGLSWFLLFLAPTMVRTLDFAYLLEQRMYLPLMGILIFMMESKIVRRMARPKPAWVATVVLIMLLGGISFVHASVYRNDIVFWQNAVRYSPDSYFAHSMLGQRYASRDLWAQAEKELLTSKELNPRDPYVRHDLGLVKYNLKDYRGALKELQNSLAMDPQMANADLFLEIAKSQVKLNMSVEAESSLKKAYDFDPRNPEANYLLSMIYYLHFDKKLSLFYYQQAVELGYPHDPRIIDRINGLKK